MPPPPPPGPPGPPIIGPPITPPRRTGGIWSRGTAGLISTCLSWIACIAPPSKTLSTEPSSANVMKPNCVVCFVFVFLVWMF
jgi:hypothetical protein